MDKRTDPLKDSTCPNRPIPKQEMDTTSHNVKTIFIIYTVCEFIKNVCVYTMYRFRFVRKIEKVTIQSNPSYNTKCFPYLLDILLFVMLGSVKCQQKNLKVWFTHVEHFVSRIRFFFFFEECVLNSDIHEHIHVYWFSCEELLHLPNLTGLYITVNHYKCISSVVSSIKPQ